MSARCTMFGVMAALLSIVASVHAAGPVQELYPNHLTVLHDFDDGTIQPTIGQLKPTAEKPEVGEQGLFGSKALVNGGFFYRPQAPQSLSAVADTTKPGTVLFWMKLIREKDPAQDCDPGCTHVNLMWSGTKRLLVFRQDGRQCGHNRGAPMSAFFEYTNPEGKRYQARSDLGSYLRNLKVGEWHLVAASWRPDGFALSYDGSPFKGVVSSEPLGKGAWSLGFSAHHSPGGGEGMMAMDDIAVLDFQLSDEQVKQLYDEYQVRLKEQPQPGDPTVELVNYGKGKKSGEFDISVKVRNPSKTAVTVECTTVARPERSQPRDLLEEATIQPGGEKVFSVSGPVLDQEQIKSGVKIVEKESGRILFARRRVFAPFAPEPEWMRAPSRVVFKFAYYPSERTIHASADLSNCEDYGKAKAARLSVFRKGETKPTLVKDFPTAADGKYEFFWRDLPDFDGEYVCQFEAVGIANTTCRQEFIRRHFPWEGNRLGMSDAVPWPFEKVKSKSEKGNRGEDLERVSVVLREHIVDKKTGLWQQVIAAGKPLLARPMRIVEVKREKGKVKSEDGNSAVQPSTSNLPPSFSTFNLQPSTSSTWDVDGLCQLTLTLAPGHYEPMALEIPLRAERAPLMHACVHGLRQNYAGKVPAGKGSVWNGTMCKGRGSIIGDYVPYLWVGGPLRGIAVFGENDRGWIVGDEVEKRGGGGQRKDRNSAVQPSTSNLQPSAHCQEIIREDDGTVVIRLNLVQCAVDLKEKRTIKLGLMATPVKPMLDNWRDVPVGTLLGACYYWGGFNSCCTLEPYDGTDTFFRKMAESKQARQINHEYIAKALAEYPYTQKPGSPERLSHEKTMKAHFECGFRCATGVSERGGLVFYTNGRGVEYGDPKQQGATFCNEWNRFEYMNRKFDRNSTAAYDLDTVASFRDYAAWWYEKMIGTGACKYMYWDDVFLTGCYNLVQTEAYRLPDGRIQPASGLYNMRELIKRCAVLQTELGRPAFGNWVHMTNTAIAPICSFAGVNFDWEDSSGELPQQTKYSKDYILACSLGRQFGNRVAIMGYFANNLNKNGEQYKWLMHTEVGVMITHEFWWNSCNQEYRDVMKKLESWGYRQSETKVWNYWDEDVAYPIEVAGGDVSSILMHNPKTGESIIGVCSFEDKELSIGIRSLKGSPLPSRDVTAVDFVSGEAVAVEDGIISFSLPKYDWKLIKITGRK